MSILDFIHKSIGCPYVYGGTGSPCTPAYRLARIKQYPQQEKNIKSNCQYLNSKKSCDSCKWYDSENDKAKLCYDCAQFTRKAFSEEGINLVSGATSQWKKTEFYEKGTIDKIPTNCICLVFRGDGKVMQHVGIYNGKENEVVHAANHKSGVISVSFNKNEWNYYGIPKGIENIINYDSASTKEKIIKIIGELNAIVKEL